MSDVAIGIDIGGTSIKLGLVNRSGQILRQEFFLTKSLQGRRAFLDVLDGYLFRLLKHAKESHLRVSGIGVGAPGPIDVARGFVYFFPNIPGWKNTPLRALLKKRYKRPIFVDNDANVMALAEYFFGAGRSARNIIALTLGTGVGGGLVMNGELFHGHKYSAAEIGHMVINENGPLCACGCRGCLETYVGSGYFVREIHRRLKEQKKGLLYRWVKDGKKITPRLVAEAAKKGDDLSKKMWKETGEHLGTALAGLANILNPELIILGGGIAQAGRILFKPLGATLRKKAFPIAATSVKVVPAKLGVDAGLIGAAALVFAHKN